MNLSELSCNSHQKLSILFSVNFMAQAASYYTSHFTCTDSKSPVRSGGSANRNRPSQTKNRGPQKTKGLWQRHVISCDMSHDLSHMTSLKHSAHVLDPLFSKYFSVNLIGRGHVHMYTCY